jgi:O-antigen ligase
MSTAPRRYLRAPSANILGRWWIVLGAAIALGMLGGAVAERKPSMALIACLVVAALLGLAILGERAYPWAIVLVCVIPWYPFIGTQAEQPIVRQKVLCAAIATAVLLPWLWSLALGGRRTRPSRGALLMGVMFLGLAILIYASVGGISGMIEAKIVGFLFAGFAFLCARRFGKGRGWQAAAFGGLVILLLLGLDAYLRAPSGRVGYFVGYPITYGALVVGLLPAGLLFAFERSRLLAAAVGLGSAALLILCESRSSWVAVVVLVLLAVVLQVRAGNVRGLAAMIASIALVGVLLLGTGSLSRIVEKKLSSNITTTQSVTHRQWSYGYAFTAIGHEPFFGAGTPGFSAEESANRTSIGAIDTGYLSITVDMGLFGLFAALIPIGVAIRAIARCLRLGVVPRQSLALALGIIGMAVVTIFYDSFYWASIDLLLGALGGALSVRLQEIGGGAQVGEGGRSRRRPLLGRRRIRWAT